MFRCFLNTEKARQIVPTIKLKRVREDDDILDLDLSEVECLKRYHTAFRAFVTSGLLYPLSKPLTENDIGKNIQTTIVDWSVAHALQGTAVIDELQANMSYTVLQAALILTITIPLYVNIPDFDDDNYSHAFSAIVGFSAFSHTLVLIACTIENMVLNRPYSNADTLLTRVETFFLFGFINVVNYAGMISGLVATLIAGFGRSSLDGYVQLYSIAMCLYLFYLFTIAYQTGTVYQDRRVFKFYKKYCDDDGQLKDEYIDKIRNDLSKDEDDHHDDRRKKFNILGVKPITKTEDADENDNQREI